MGGAADFFISYTSADRAWAEWIAWQLEAEGYQVVVQAWDFAPGRDWAHEMQQATVTAERVVAVLSTAYLQSAHGEAEWRVFYADDPSGEQGRLLPVRVGPVEPPGLLKTRVYVDLVNKDAASARAALLAAARRARGKPTEEPRFPGGQRPEVSATEVPRFPAELPPVWNVPFHPNPFFVGRDLLLAELHTRLRAPNLPTRRVALTGLGGVGKTSVAVEYVYRRHADYDLVWCVNGEQPASLLADLATLADHLGLAADAPQEAQVAALRSWMERHQHWLLVLDNVDDPHQVAELLPRSATGQVVITSRTGVGWERLANVLPVDVLAPTDAAELLLTRARETGPEAEAAAPTLAATLDGLPLALEQAGAYVAATGSVSLAGYAELFDTWAPELLRRGQPLGYQHTVATTWSLTLQALRETDPPAADLLTLASFLAPDDLPLPLITTHHEQLPEPLTAMAGEPLGLADAVAALRRYSLIRIVADGVYVHRLLQTVIRTALEAHDERAWAATAVRLLRSAFPHRSDDVAAWPECERLLPHVLAAVDHGQSLDVEAEAWPSLLHEAAVYLHRRGRYRQALDLHQQVLAVRRRTLGDDHPDTLASMNKLAESRWILGDPHGARELHEQTLAARRRVLGDDHRDTLDSMNNLALDHQALGDLHGARDLHQQALAARRQLLGDDHPDTLASMNNLAETLAELGDLQGAHDLHEQTLAAGRRLHGDDHRYVLISLNNLADVRRALGDLQGARDLHEQALAARRRVLGDDHPHTLQSMNNLADVRRALGDLDGARQLHEQALTGYRRVLGEDHPDTLLSMNNLAEVCRELGEL